jgi:hypothetical protein
MAESTSQVPVTSSVQVTTTSSIRPASTLMSTTPVMTVTSAPISTPSSTQTSTVRTSSIGSTKSMPGTSTRPIITPTPTFTPGPTTQLISSSSRLSFGEIVGLVAIVVVVLGVVGMCVVLGPRRALRKVGIGRKPREPGEYEEWEDGEKQPSEGDRPASGAASDWWRAPAGAHGSRVSIVSTGGPGMAGVGAGSRVAQSTRTEERKAVRSGWFATSMVRGASLLSLGSMLKPEPATEMRQMSGQGSAGRRFQELYRRERAAERVAYPTVRRPSRLGTVPAVVPAILVHDATLPSLSSTRGYEADVEAPSRVY